MKIYGGGFGSALAVDPKTPGYFYLLTDRGPNTDNNNPDEKVFPLPRFTPQIGRFRLDGDKLVLVKTIELRDAKGRKVTGLPNPTNGNTGEIAVDLQGRKLGTDPNGIDSEGLVALPDGTFWISDEYGPWLVHVDATGRMLKRVGPFPGSKSLPRVLALRRANRGMESLTITPDGSALVGMMQNPLDNPDATIRKHSRLNRILVYDPRTGASLQYRLSAGLDQRRRERHRGDLEYRLSHPRARPVLCRRSEVAVQAQARLPDRHFTGYRSKRSEHARNGKRVNEKTLEQLTDAELAAAGIVTVSKKLIVDLLAMPGGYPHDKAEGLAIINPTTIAVSNDDDFGIVPDGKGGIAPKTLPSENNRVDVNRVYFIRLKEPLR